jgi:hypothetical protein
VTVSASSLTNSGPYVGSGGSFYQTATVTAPAGSLLAFWCSTYPEPTISGFGLDWSLEGSVGFPEGELFLFTAAVGDTEVTGEVSTGGDMGGLTYDLDCVSGNDGESLQFGTGSAGAVGTQGGGNTAYVTISAGEPYLYLFASSVAWEDGSNGASPGESPTAWTQLAMTGRTYGVYLETQVSPDGTNPTGVANWSNGYNGWGALGIAVSSSS